MSSFPAPPKGFRRIGSPAAAGTATQTEAQSLRAPEPPAGFRRVTAAPAPDTSMETAAEAPIDAPPPPSGYKPVAREKLDAERSRDVRAEAYGRYAKLPGYRNKSDIEKEQILSAVQRQGGLPTETEMADREAARDSASLMSEPERLLRTATDKSAGLTRTINRAIHGQEFDDYFEASDLLLEEANKNKYWSTKAAEIAGYVTDPVAQATGLGAYGAVGRLAPGLAARPIAAGMLAEGVAGATVGAGEAIADPETRNPVDIARSAAIGGVGGAVGAGVLGLAGRGIAKGIQKGRDVLSDTLNARSESRILSEIDALDAERAARANAMAPAGDTAPLGLPTADVTPPVSPTAQTGAAPPNYPGVPSGLRRELAGQTSPGGRATGPWSRRVVAFRRANAERSQAAPQLSAWGNRVVRFRASLAPKYPDQAEGAMIGDKFALSERERFAGEVANMGDALRSVDAAPPPVPDLTPSGAIDAPTATSPTDTTTAPEAFYSGVPLNPADIDDALKPVAGFLRKNFTTIGDLPPEVHAAKVRSRGYMTSESAQAAYNLRDLNAATKAAYGRAADRLTPAQTQRIGDALTGRIPISSMPEPLQPALTAMRTHADALSRKLINEGVVEGKLVPIIEANMGTYLTRSYRVFDDPSWANKVAPEVRNKAKAFIRSEFADMPEPEVEGMIDNLLFKDLDGPIGALQRLGSKDLSILKRRKDIPPEIRALWGEYADAPQVNYVRSVERMSGLIANHKLLTEARSSGLGKWLFERPVVQGGQSYSAQIASEGSSTMSPLNGLYATREVAAAFNKMNQPEQVGQMMRLYFQANGATKYAATVLNATTHIRNTLGNFGFLVANGHYRVGNAGDAAKTVLANLGALNRTQLRERWREMAELGVVGDSVHGGALGDLLKDANRGNGLDDLIGNAALKKLKSGAKAINSLYAAEDDLFKVIAFDSELARYRKALPNLSESELKQRVAGIIRDTLPTYSNVPNAFKQLQRVPVVAPFVSFPAEVVRTGYHTMRLIAQELADPATRSIGAERLAGALTMAGATAAIAGGSRFITGTSVDEDRDLRHFLPEWSQNSQLAHLGTDDQGRIRVVDLSYTDPYSALRKPLMAFANGEDWEAALMDAGWEALRPLITEQLLTERVADVWRNQKSNGQRIYNPQAPLLDRWGDVLGHIADSFTPGTFRATERISKGIRGSTEVYGNSYDPALEALAVTTGQRVQVVDVKQSLSYKAFEFSRQLADARAILSQTATRRGTVEDAEIRKAAAESSQSQRTLFERMTETAKAAQRLGLKPIEVGRILVASGISNANARAIIAGRFPDFRPDTRRVERMAELSSIVQSDPERRDSEVADLRRRARVMRELGLDPSFDTDPESE